MLRAGRGWKKKTLVRVSPSALGRLPFGHSMLLGVAAAKEVSASTQAPLKSIEWPNANFSIALGCRKSSSVFFFHRIAPGVFFIIFSENDVAGMSERRHCSSCLRSSRFRRSSVVGRKCASVENDRFLISVQRLFLPSTAADPQRVSLRRTLTLAFCAWTATPTRARC